MAATQPFLEKRKPGAASWLRSLRSAFARQGDTLELLLPRGWPESHGPVQWRLREGPGLAPYGRVTELNQIPGIGALTRVLVWTPPSDTLLTRVTLPTRSRAKIQQALPFALEEQIIGEPEQLHFSYRIQDDGSLAVAVTARERMQSWLSQLNDAGLRPTGFCPALLALPLDTGSWTAAFHDNDLWVRTGKASGFACAAGANTPPAMLELALREAREKQDAPIGLLVIHPPAGFNPEAWSSPLKLPVTVQKQDFWTEYHEPVPALNLLQGSYAPSRQMQELLPGMRPAAIMLAIWLIGGLGFNLWEWWSLKNTHDNLRKEMAEVIRQVSPNANVVTGQEPLQMQRLLAELQGSGGKSPQADALPLLGNIAPVIQAQTKLKLRAIQYEGSRLTLDISLPDFQTMETVKNAFTARGLQVEVVGANSTAAGIEGRLRLSLAAARTGT